MPENNISLIYNNIKRNIKTPKNYSDLQSIFIKEFNEDTNKIFYFSYLSFIDKESDFSKIMNQIKEQSNSSIYVFFIEEDLNNKMQRNLNINEEKEIILKSPKEKEYKNIHLNEETKNKLKKINIENNTFNEINKINFRKKNIIPINYNNEIFINKNKDSKIKVYNLNFKNIDLRLDSYCYIVLDNSFNVFKSIDNILYLIYTNKNNSIISYNLINNCKIIEIKNAHKQYITNFRYYLDKKNKRDLIISISAYDNNIK